MTENPGERDGQRLLSDQLFTGFRGASFGGDQHQVLPLGKVHDGYPPDLARLTAARIQQNEVFPHLEVHIGPRRWPGSALCALEPKV